MPPVASGGIDGFPVAASSTTIAPACGVAIHTRPPETTSADGPPGTRITVGFGRRAARGQREHDRHHDQPGGDEESAFAHQQLTS